MEVDIYGGVQEILALVGAFVQYGIEDIFTVYRPRID